ncbi:hypothetical protein J6590_033250 [Homalodisca vitripennis]|nr:hypothetical protein J6590_033250 [Homalodisca vitripennis]
MPWNGVKFMFSAKLHSVFWASHPVLGVEGRPRHLNRNINTKVTDSRCGTSGPVALQPFCIPTSSGAHLGFFANFNGADGLNASSEHMSSVRELKSTTTRHTSIGESGILFLTSGGSVIFGDNIPPQLMPIRCSDPKISKATEWAYKRIFTGSTLLHSSPPVSVVGRGELYTYTGYAFTICEIESPVVMLRESKRSCHYDTAETEQKGSYSNNTVELDHVVRKRFKHATDIYNLRERERLLCSINISGIPENL